MREGSRTEASPPEQELGACAVERRRLLAEGASESEPEGQAVREANCRRARKGALAAGNESLQASASVSEGEGVQAATRREAAMPWESARRPLGTFFRDHVREARESLAFVAGSAGTTLLVWLLMGIALGLPAGLYILQANLAGVADDWRGSAGISVYFQPGVAAAVPQALSERLRGEAGVAGVRLITSDEALAEFRGYGDIAGAVELLGGNPLPATLRVSFAAPVSAGAAETLSKRLRQEEGVDDVVLEQTWLERVASLSALVERLGWVVALVLGVGAVLVTSSSVRVALESRLDELRVLKLVGGTDPFMRRAFLYLGCLYGLGGAIFAAMIVSLTLVTVEQPLAQLLSTYGGDLELRGFDTTFVLVLLGVGALLGVIGSVVACRQRLRNLDILA